MHNYPSPSNRLTQRRYPTKQEKQIAKKFDKDFFDGERKFGYGGFNYDPKYWSETVQIFIEEYNLTNVSTVLDVGCGKGFMLVDLVKRLPGIRISGIDISEYAIQSAHELVSKNVQVANCLELPFEDNSFDLVISINTIHNLDKKGCIRAIQEIERVKKKDSYIVVDGWDTRQERKDLKAWVLTAQTVLKTKSWERLFGKAGYTGDYSFWKVK